MSTHWQTHAVLIKEPPGDRKAASALVVDLEGALVKTNLLVESLLVLLKRNPLCAFLLPVWFLRGKAFFEQQVTGRAPLDASLLPYRQDVLEYLKAQRAQGRTLLLATRRDLHFAQQVANHLNIFDEVFTSDVRTAVSPEIARAFVPPKRAFADYLKPLRSEHWLKNLLVFVPLLAAHRFDEIDCWERCCWPSGVRLFRIERLSDQRLVRSGGGSASSPKAIPAVRRGRPSTFLRSRNDSGARRPRLPHRHSGFSRLSLKWC